MKPQLVVSTGKETTDVELAILQAIFDEHFNATCHKSIVRLSAIDMNLIIEFTIAAIGSGIYYDALKNTLIKLFELFKSEKLERTPNATIKIDDQKWILNDKRIVLINSEDEIEFIDMQDFIEYIKTKE